MGNISVPTVQRLCSMFKILQELHTIQRKIISSSELGTLCGTTANTVRKDISKLGVTGNSGSGYEVIKLMKLIGNTFDFFNKKRTCIIGLGKLGSALLKHSILKCSEFDIVAGFDSNINRIETLSSEVPLFPFCQLIEVVKRMSIEYGLCAVPEKNAQEVADKLSEAGIKGIINFAPVMIRLTNKNVIIKNIDIIEELRILTAFTAIRTTSF